MAAGPRETRAIGIAIVAAWVVASVDLAAPARADVPTTPLPCPADAAARAEAIRAHLDREAVRARRWDLGWGLGFGAVAIGYGAMAATRWELGRAVDDHADAGLWVGAVKGGIAALSHAVLPLRVVRPPAPSGDPCTDAAAAARALQETADHETTAFWLGELGNVALNGGALLWLGLREHTWTEGLVGAAIGAPVGLLHAWSAPHASRRGLAEGRFDGPPASWRIDAAAGPGFTGVVMSGSF